jgi:hypothetical protein
VPDANELPNSLPEAGRVLVDLIITPLLKKYLTFCNIPYNKQATFGNFRPNDGMEVLRIVRSLMQLNTLEKYNVYKNARRNTPERFLC